MERAHRCRDQSATITTGQWKSTSPFADTGIASAICLMPAQWHRRPAITAPAGNACAPVVAITSHSN